MEKLVIATSSGNVFLYNLAVALANEKAISKKKIEMGVERGLVWNYLERVNFEAFSYKVNNVGTSTVDQSLDEQYNPFNKSTYNNLTENNIHQSPLRSADQNGDQDGFNTEVKNPFATGASQFKPLRPAFEEVSRNQISGRALEEAPVRVQTAPLS